MSNPVLVLDTNLLVLYVVGCVSRFYIAKHRRLQAYTEKDFDLLSSMISAVSSVIVTPNVLTETSNLIGQIGEPARSHIFECFQKLIEISEEEYHKSKDAVAQRGFVRLGLADSVSLDATNKSRTLLTSDLGLYPEACHQGMKAVNFNHYRLTNA